MCSDRHRCSEIGLDCRSWHCGSFCQVLQWSFGGCVSGSLLLLRRTWRWKNQKTTEINGDFISLQVMSLTLFIIHLIALTWGSSSSHWFCVPAWFYTKIDATVMLLYVSISSCWYRLRYVECGHDFRFSTCSLVGGVEPHDPPNWVGDSWVATWICKRWCNFWTSEERYVKQITGLITLSTSIFGYFYILYTHVFKYFNLHPPA